MRESELSDALGSLVDRVEQTVNAVGVIKSRNVVDDLKRLADRLVAVGEKLYCVADASTASQWPQNVEAGEHALAVENPAGGSKKPAGALVALDDGDQDAPGRQSTEWDTYFGEEPSTEDAEQSAAAADETDIFAPDEESPIDLTHDTDEERENVPVEQPSRQVDTSKFFGLGWSKNESQADRSLSRLSSNLSEPPRTKTDLGLSGLPQQDVFPSPKPRGPKKEIDPVDHLIDSTDRLLNIDLNEIGNESDNETPPEPEEEGEEEMDIEFHGEVAVPEANITDDAEESKSEQQDASRDAKAVEEEDDDDDGPRKRGGGRKALRIDSDDDDEPKETAGKTRPKKTIESDDEQSGEEEDEEEEDGSQAEESDRSESPEFNDREADFLNFNPTVDDSDEEAEEDDESPKGVRTSARAANLFSKKSTRPSSKRAHYEDTDEEAIYLTDDEDEYKLQKAPPTAKPLKKRRKVVVLDSDPEALSVEEEEEAPADSPSTKKKKGKKQISTLYAEREERLRLQRLAEKQKAFNGIVLAEDASDLSTSFSQVVEKGPAVRSVLLDPDTKGKPPHPVEVHPLLVRKLKPHQAEGVKFMFDSTIESLDRLRFAGGGCILSHVMGLGKTMQSITFLHTILTHSVISKKIRRVLIFVPKNVLLNWHNEFTKWLRHNDRSLDTIKIFKMTADKNAERLEVLKEWKNCNRPSVMLIGYELFRRLTQDLTINAKGKPRKMSEADKKLHKLQPEFRKYLIDPGADLVVLDEGHLLKNPKTALTKSMVKISTLRRIILSGTPMQNHLNEYHTMVDFVRPNLLGSVKEFGDKFRNPIEKGRTKDADAHDVQLMKRTAHILHKRLNKVLDRKDYDVLTEAIPPKQEYVISCYCSDVQLRLYEHFINEIVNRMHPNERRLFVVQAAHIVNRFTSHVYNLIENEKRKAAEKARKALKDFVVDEEEEVEDEAVEDEEHGSEAADVETPVPSPQPDWFRVVNVVSEEDKNKFETSAKLMVLAQLLKECEEIGDKVLVFGQSLENLRLIQRMLEFMQKTWFDDHTAAANVRGETWAWKRDRDYAMIDGSVNIEERERIQRLFNDIENPRTRLCLISTKAGALGTNFVGANRVVIFDLSWNPTHDQQALFRAYRFGQVKPVYVYRLASLGLESRRHYTNEDLEKMLSVPDEIFIEDAPKLYGPPEDKLLASVFQKCPWAIHNCWQHDSLLLNDVSEQLSPEERDAAWAEFERRSTQSVMRTLPPNQRRFIQSCKNHVEAIRNGLKEEEKNSLLVNELLEAGCDMTEALVLGCVFNLLFKGIYDMLPADQKAAYEELNDPHELLITMTHETKSDDIGVGTLLEVQQKCRTLFAIFGKAGALGDVFEMMEERIPGLIRDPPQPASSLPARPPALRDPATPRL